MSVTFSGDWFESEVTISLSLKKEKEIIAYKNMLTSARKSMLLFLNENHMSENIATTLTDIDNILRYLDQY